MSQSPSPFRGAHYAKTPKAVSVAGAGGYHSPTVMSPHQFSHVSAGFRFRQQVGSTRIMISKGSPKFSVGGGGYRFSSGGRLSHIEKSQ
jgi:hypothetical protein